MIDLELIEYNLEFDLAELGEDHSECGWPTRVQELIDELRATRVELDSLKIHTKCAEEALGIAERRIKAAIMVESVWSDDDHMAVLEMIFELQGREYDVVPG